MASYDGRWKTVDVKVEAGIAWVTLNRPEKRNAMSPTLNSEMLQVLDAVELDDDARVLVLTGAGAAWTAGMDLKEYFREVDAGPEILQEKIRRDASEITNAVTTMGFIARNPGSIDVAQRVIDYFQRTVFEQLTTESWGLGQLQLDMRAKLDQMADLRRLDVSFRKLAATFQVPKNWVLLERTLLLLIGLCIELAPSWNPMTVIRPYLEGVVAGPDRSWTDLIVTAIKEMAKSAAVLPEDVRQTLGRANRGELEIRVPEINAAARLVYAGARQLIFAVIGTASGVLSYQAYDRGQRLIALPLLVIAIVFLGGLTWSMLVVSRRR